MQSQKKTGISPNTHLPNGFDTRRTIVAIETRNHARHSTCYFVFLALLSSYDCLQMFGRWVLARISYLSFFSEVKNNLKAKTYNLKPNSGFSLVELMVSISIFVLITSMTLANYPKFSNKLSLDLLTEDIALSFRQAQIFSSSVTGSNSGGQLIKAFGSYGLHFEAPNTFNGAGNYNYPYLLFADKNKNAKYDGPSAFGFKDNGPFCDGKDNECLERFLISGFNQVKFLCKDFEKGGLNSDQRVRACENSSNQIQNLDVIFRRPNLDANFTILDANNSSVVGSSEVSTIGIVLESPGGEYYKTVVVWKTGQIAVE